MSAINYSELTYDRKEKGEYRYPDSAVGIGWGLACLSVFFIPFFMIIRVVKTLVNRKVRTFIEICGVPLVQ
jgi:solute carrier family 6 GABA transporter-like protein 6/8/11/12/13